MEGRVVAFDASRGLGTIEGSDGRSYAFHCTQVADGSRLVPVGARVTYDVVPGSLGTWEAAAVSVVAAD